MKADIVIENAIVLTKEFEFLRNHTIVINNKKIVDIFETGSKDYDFKDKIEGRNKLVMPGLIDGHTHLTQQLLRGMISDEYPVIYKRFNLPLESKLTPNQVKLSTELGCLEMIKSGTTSFADAGGTHTHKMVEGVMNSGLRAVLTRSTSDTGEGIPKNMKETTEEGLRLSEKFYLDYNNYAEGRIKVWFQYRTLASCTDELIVGLTNLAKKYKTGVHTHISEYGEAVLYSLRTHGMREIEYLDHLGVMFPKLLAAHCCLVSENDIKILRDTNTKVIHCPRSNLGKAVTKTPSMLNHGISVGFGTDGTAHSGLSLFREITAFKHSQIITHGVPYLDFSVMNSKIMLEMLTMGGARAIGMEDEIGSLEIGKIADIITIDLNKPHILPTHNLLNTLMESVNSNDVCDSIVDGKIIMRNRKVLTLDEDCLLAEAGKNLELLNKLNNWSDDNLITLDRRSK